MHCSSTTPAGRDCAFFQASAGADIIRRYAGDTAIVRRQLRAGEALFDMGDPATNYYLLLRGTVMVDLRVGTKSSRLSLLGEGQLFIFACGENHVARCVATADSVILRINRRQCDRSAQSSPLLLSALQSTHAEELSLILGALKGENCKARSISSELPASGSPPDAPETFASQSIIRLRVPYRGDANARTAQIS